MLQEHTHCRLTYDIGMEPGATNPAVVATDKAGFCIALALAAFEEGMKVHEAETP